jgi:hypothetical protein
MSYLRIGKLFNASARMVEEVHAHHSRGFRADVGDVLGPQLERIEITIAKPQ